MEVNLTADDADNAVQERSKQTSFRFFYQRYLRDLRLIALRSMCHKSDDRGVLNLETTF